MTPPTPKPDHTPRRMNLDEFRRIFAAAAAQPESTALIVLADGLGQGNIPGYLSVTPMREGEPQARQIDQALARRTRFSGGFNAGTVFIGLIDLKKNCDQQFSELDRGRGLLNRRAFLSIASNRLWSEAEPDSLYALSAPKL